MRQPVRRAIRILPAVLFGFMASMTGFSDDVGGASDGERCTSWLGTPIIEWSAGFWGDLLIPL